MLQLSQWGERPRTRRSVIWVLNKTNTETRTALRRDDQNFIDLTGVVRLHLPGLYVDRNDLEPVRAATNDRRRAFSDAASLVPRALFERGTKREGLGIQALAGRTGLAISTVSYAVCDLEAADLIETQRSGRSKSVRLKDAGALVRQWALQYSWQDNDLVAFHAPAGDPERFLRRLTKLLGRQEWALTLQAGASRVAAHATWDTVHVYVRARGTAELTRIGQSMGWEPSSGGRVVLLAPYYRESVWPSVRTLDGLRVVSDLQLILDLWHYPVRGREQAEVLLEPYVDDAGS